MKSASPSAVRALRGLGLLALFFCVAVVLQILSGAYRAEFGGYPDESAHYVTGLMVRDYIASLHYSEPMEFAKNYYAHYPKVAFGHWPPLFYVVEALWMLVFSPARQSVLVELALLTALLAWLTYRPVKRHFGEIAGVLSGVFLVCLPIVQISTGEVMAESLLTLVTFASVLSFARYTQTRNWRHGILFALFASCAILTKGSGWDLALVPPIAILLSRDFTLLKRWSLWLSGALVAAICAPWQFLTLSLAQLGWYGGGPNLAYTSQAIGGFSWILVELLGWSLAPLILVGIAVKVIVPAYRARVQPEWAAFAALIAAAVLFHDAIPAGIEPRRLIVAVPALIMFLFAGGDWLAKTFRLPPAVVALAALAAFGIQRFSIPREFHYGYSDAAGFVAGRRDPRDAVVLVSSQHDGEGMFISELPMREHRLSHRVVRGTKVLSSTDWNGTVSQCYYQTPEALLEFLKSAGVGLVVYDNFPQVLPFPHHAVIATAVAKYPARLKLIATFQGEVKGEVAVYRFD
jgi:hypothetical protein